MYATLNGHNNHSEWYFFSPPFYLVTQVWFSWSEIIRLRYSDVTVFSVMPTILEDRAQGAMNSIDSSVNRLLNARKSSFIYKERRNEFKWFAAYCPPGLRKILWNFSFYGSFSITFFGFNAGQKRFLKFTTSSVRWADGVVSEYKSDSDIPPRIYPGKAQDWLWLEGPLFTCYFPVLCWWGTHVFL